MSHDYGLPATLGIDNKTLATLGALGNVNMDALAGMSVGGFPSIRLNGTRFVAQEGDNRINLPVLELPMILLRAAPNIRKVWYATKYDPNKDEETRQPDCFSDDGVRPNPQSAMKQNEHCAACPHNVFGSGKGPDGQPSKGKACSDLKQLAVLSPTPRQHGAENEIFGMRIPPASLKNFAGYVKALTNRGIPLTAVVTNVGFDGAMVYPVLTFKFAGVVPETMLGALAEKAQSEEVDAIINPIRSASSPAPVPAAHPVAQQPTPPPAAPAPVAPAPVVDPLAGFGLSPAPATPAPAAPVAAPAPAPAPAPAAPAAVDPFAAFVAQATPAATPAAAPAAAQPQAAPTPAVAEPAVAEEGSTSDAELAAALGL